MQYTRAPVIPLCVYKNVDCSFDNDEPSAVAQCGCSEPNDPLFSRRILAVLSATVGSDVPSPVCVDVWEVVLWVLESVSNMSLHWRSILGVLWLLPLLLLSWEVGRSCSHGWLSSSCVDERFATSRSKHRAKKSLQVSETSFGMLLGISEVLAIKNMAE